MRNYKILYIEPEYYLGIIFNNVTVKPSEKLPIGTKIEQIFAAPERRAIGFLLSHPLWPEVNLGEIPPTLCIEKEWVFFCTKCGLPIERSEIHNCVPRSNFANKILGAMDGLAVGKSVVDEVDQTEDD